MSVAPHSADGLLQREAVPAHDDIAEAFVRRAVFVGRGRGGGEPAFVDAAAIQAVGVEIVGMQLEALARLEERARHPARREPEQAAGGGDLGFDKSGDVLLDRLQGGKCIHSSRGLRSILARSNERQARFRAEVCQLRERSSFAPRIEIVGVPPLWSFPVGRASKQSQFRLGTFRK